MQTDHGLFLCFDGPPQSGRTTLADRLAAALAAPEHAYEVVRVAAPVVDGPLRHATRDWLAEYIAACVAITEETVQPAMARGCVVIADGWITSAMLRARAGTSIATTALVGMWAKGTHTLPPDVEYLLSHTDSPIGKAVARELYDWESVVCSQVRGHHPPAPLTPRTERRIYVDPNLDTLASAIIARTLHILRLRASEAPEGEEAWSAMVAEDRVTRECGHVAALVKEMVRTRGKSAAIHDLVARYPLLTPEAQAHFLAALPEASKALEYVQTIFARADVAVPQLAERLEACRAKEAEVARAEQERADALRDAEAQAPTESN